VTVTVVPTAELRVPAVAAPPCSFGDLSVDEGQAQAHAVLLAGEVRST